MFASLAHRRTSQNLAHVGCSRPGTRTEQQFRLCCALGQAIHGDEESIMVAESRREHVGTGVECETGDVFSLVSPMDLCDGTSAAAHNWS